MKAQLTFEDRRDEQEHNIGGIDEPLESSVGYRTHETGTLLPQKTECVCVCMSHAKGRWLCGWPRRRRSKDISWREFVFEKSMPFFVT